MDKKKFSPLKIGLGILFLLLLVLTVIIFHGKFDALPYEDPTRGWKIAAVQISEILFLALSLLCFIPYVKYRAKENLPTDKKLSKYTWIATLIVLVAVPFTIYAGIKFFNDTKFYFISFLIILETIVPFFLAFEKRKPSARELILISVLCAIGVAGRIVFAPIPQFKPLMAIIIIISIAFGAETGFLCGAISAFVSNMYFGQGAWTPWQMFASGIVGFVAGIIFNKGILRKNALSISIFGVLATLLLYGIVVDSNSLMFYPELNAPTVLSVYILGIPFNLIHAVATGAFLWFLSEPMLEKFERIKTKYGVLK